MSRGPAENDPDGPTLFEATGRVTDIKEVRFVTLMDGEHPHTGSIMGARLRVGGNQVMEINADLQGIHVDAVQFGERHYDHAVVDVIAQAVIDLLPDEITFCMREQGIKNGSGTDTAVTAACEVANPFDGAAVRPRRLHARSGRPPLAVDHRL